jgi:hypothetical protein
MHRGKIATLILCLLFVSFAAVQFNDPDPLPWMALYLYVAALFGLAAFGKFNRYTIWAGLAVCLIWMATLLPDFIHWLQMGAPSIVTEMKATQPHIELTREFLGLGVCLGALVWLRWKVNQSDL